MISQVLGRYHIDTKIGEGQFASIYRARDVRLNRLVAVKILKKSNRGGGVDWGRLLREARIVSKLNHPSICSIFDVGEDQDQYFLVCELIQGRSLKETLASGPLPIRTSMRICLIVGEALAHAHSLGVVHRDLSPSNVMVVSPEEIKVIDFGQARLLNGNVALDLSSQASQAETSAYPFGTLAYTAPEVLHGESTSVQSDLWSLGTIFYEMLTGDLPFWGRTPFEIGMSIMVGRMGPIGRHVPRGVRAIVRRCLAVEKGKRYDSADELCLHIGEELMSMGATPHPNGGRARRLLSPISTLFSHGGNRK